MVLSSFHKARKLAVTHGHAPVNSGGKPMNEDLSDVNKDIIESKVESKQITQDSRPKEGQTPIPCLSYQFNRHNLSATVGTKTYFLSMCSQRSCSCPKPSCCTEATAENVAGRA